MQSTRTVQTMARKNKDTVKERLETLREMVEEEALTMDGYDDCIMGTCQQFGRPSLVAYDLEKVIKKLMKDGCTREEAEEFWSFNQIGAYMGDYTPVFITKI
jgi:hypothetical protein